MQIILAYIIGHLPSNLLRVFFYKNILGYTIDKSHLGWRTIIAVEKAEIFESKIGPGNQFIGPFTMQIKKGVKINEKNQFHCGKWTKTKAAQALPYERYMELRENSHISPSNYFDISGSFILGKNSWIAGRGSQFWTHGASADTRTIFIGEDCYIGSAVRFKPQTSLGNNSLVALGSIVTKTFKENNIVIGGNPAKILRKNYDWKTKKEII